MKKQRFHYAISGYRWAPESFRAGKGPIGQPTKDLPLTAEECRNVGVLFLTKGYASAVGYVKHTERARERQRKSMITYGFYTKEVTGQFIYCPQLICRSDASLEERLRMFKKIKSVLRETGGRVTVSTQCELDGEYRPINITENTITADFCRPLRIPIGYQLVRDCPERPYRPRHKVPKKAQPHKHRNTAPTR